LALFAAAPVMIVPDPECQFCGTWPTTRWFGADGVNGAAFALPVAPLLELELTVKCHARRDNGRTERGAVTRPPV